MGILTLSNTGGEPMSWINEREEIINRIKCSETIHSEQVFTYKLTHYYDFEPRPHYFKSNVSPDVMDALIAYIQFEMDDIEMAYSIDQTEVINILCEFYQARESKRGKSMHHIDLYYNREKWCGVSDEVQNIELFQRKGLKERLKEMHIQSKEEK